MLTFEDQGHVYRWDGERVPSVTQALSLLVDYSMVPAGLLERARQEGVAVHKTVELYETGDLDVVPEWLTPRLNAYIKFKSESGFKVIHCEHRFYSAKYRFAGTPDLIGGFGLQKAVIDIKRSLLAGPVIGLQLAAYREAAAVLDGARLALVLRADGSYRLTKYEDRSDFNAFLAALSCYKWRQNNGLVSAADAYV